MLAMLQYISLHLLLLGSCLAQQADNSLPVLLNTDTLRDDPVACPSAEGMKGVNELILSKVVPIFECPCGGSGSWHHIRWLTLT